jgi:hypothetical protein
VSGHWSELGQNYRRIDETQMKSALQAKAEETRKKARGNEESATVQRRHMTYGRSAAVCIRAAADTAAQCYAFIERRNKRRYVANVLIRQRGCKYMYVFSEKWIIASRFD